MTHVLAIARREIEERAFVFVAAIAMALVSLVVLVIPHGTFAERKGVVVILGFFLGVAFTWALALILGSTLIGRELSEKRLSFYFTRPISGSAVWFGKLLAALVLLAVSFAIVHAIPLGIGYHEFQTMSTVTRTTAVAGVLAIAVVLLAIAHVLSTWVRSRSPILGVDFVALLTVIGISLGTVVPLLAVNAWTPVLNVVAILIVAIVVAFLGGGAWQLSRGRIDVRRNHRELSTFVWIVVGVASITGLIYSRWVLGASPRDLRVHWVSANGNTIAIEGEARGYWMNFIVNPATGAFIRNSSVTATEGDVVASLAPAASLTNVQRALAHRRDLTDTSVVVSKLEREPRTIASLPVSGAVTALGVNGDGSRLAIVADRILTVYDSHSRSALASSTLMAGRDSQLRFVAPDVVRAFVTLGTELRVRDFNVRSRAWSDVAGPMKIRSELQYGTAGSLLLTRNDSSAEVRDLRNPAAVQSIPLGKDDGVWLMNDGRVAIYHRAQPAYIEIRSHGVQQRIVRFGREFGGVRVSGEIGRGKLIAIAFTQFGARFDPSVQIIDADSGAVSRVIPHAWSAGPWVIGASDPEVRYRPIVHRDTGKIDVIDLQTGAIRPLFE